MRLDALISTLPHVQVLGRANTDISSVAYDSRRAGRESLFVAVPGLKEDGHDYLRQASAAGAAAVMVQADREAKWRPLLADHPPAVLVVEDTRAALADVSAAWYRHPGRELGVIGVTGTDGKTSLCYLLEHIFTTSEKRTGLVTTAECRIGNSKLMDIGRFTTPESPELQWMLREMADGACDWAVLEATSHGLALHRLNGCEFDIAAVTCVGRDHLDFHGSAENYLAAKARLFQLLDISTNKGIEKTSVLNFDDLSYSRLAGASGSRVVSYGLSERADVRASEVSEEAWTTRFLLEGLRTSLQIRMTRPGLFNVYNALAAVAISTTAGLELEAIAHAIESWPGAPGRMEFIDEGQPFTVVVDFAHAPDSLHRVLELLRSRSPGRIIVVFGCIGEREKDRRAAMGRVAAELANYTIVTDDNPYTEDRGQIIREIEAGLTSAGKWEGHDFSVVPDRREAIAQALAMAVGHDVVLLAGKGHEREVYLGDSSYECDDRMVARAALRVRLGQS